MCIFCDIVEGKIPSTKVFENDKVLAFKDINPATPVHVLIVPKKHFDDILDMSSSAEGKEALGDVLDAIPEVVKATGIDEGFRVINNCREFGGQTVKHVHFHIVPRYGSEPISFENHKGDMDALKALAERIRL